MTENQSIENTPPTQSNAHTDPLWDAQVLQVGLSHICDAARIPEHPQHQDACNAVASVIWDLYMGADNETALTVLYRVTSAFNRKEGALN